MLVHDALSFHIYFGDAADAVYPASYKKKENQSFMANERIKAICKQFRITSLFFLHQVHGIEGYLITPQSRSLMPPFSCDGDYLITKEPMFGLGVMTADCLPLVCFDKKNKAIGIAHVGWRGAFGGVISAMINAMHREWQTKTADCIFFLGPSAKRCCYTVSPPFAHTLKKYPWHQQVLHKSNDQLFFNLPLFTAYQLKKLGVPNAHIQTHYNTCTICHINFYSYRRATMAGNPNTGRQMTIAVLK